MGEEEERVRKLDEQSVRRPASQSQLFNPRQGSLDWASERARGGVGEQAGNRPDGDYQTLRHNHACPLLMFCLF